VTAVRELADHGNRPGLADRVAAAVGPIPEWQERALCAQTDSEAFFPEKGGSTREAKRVCQDCPVRMECLEYAMANDERFGIWGGLSERERRRLKRALGDRGIEPRRPAQAKPRPPLTAPVVHPPIPMTPATPPPKPLRPEPVPAMAAAPVPAKPAPRQRVKRPPVTVGPRAFDHEELRALMDAGLTVQQIGKRLHLTPTLTRQVLGTVKRTRRAS
jgi:WhiB family transcriptional regulator, redox-sensing transcriptional regulator